MQVHVVEKIEDQNLYLLVPHYITFYTMSFGEISHSYLQEKDEESTFLGHRGLLSTLDIRL